MNLEIFSIKALHGRYDYEIQFKNNNLIMIGENGSCKTTIIRMLFYFLSMQWKKLSAYDFKSIAITVNGEKVRINKQELPSDVRDNEQIMHLPMSLRRALINYPLIDEEYVHTYCVRNDIPEKFIWDILKSDNSSVTQNAKESIAKLSVLLEGCHIIYLPTYRRIEQDLPTVLDGRFDEEDFRRINRRRTNPKTIFSELVEFGMNDVNVSITETLETLKDFYNANISSMTLSYLGDIVNEKYESIDLRSIKRINESTIDYIMSRVSDRILPNITKDHLRETIARVKNSNDVSDHDKIVCHYFMKLLSIHQELESREEAIRQFTDVCRKYIQKKDIIYDSFDFRFNIYDHDTKKEIALNQLSSGEKQIVSLFSYLTLSGNKNNLVLIDEPELSLSVRWQKMLLEDVYYSGYCSGVIAVTHSPFVFDNTLAKFARGLGEFIR